MKRLLTFFACFVLGGSLAASADTTVPIIDTDYGATGWYTGGDTIGYLTCTRTPVEGTSLDEIDITMGDVVGVAAGASLQTMFVTWSAVGTGAQLSVGTGANTRNWPSETANPPRGEANTSYLYFGSIMAGGIDPNTGLSWAGSCLTFARTGTWDTVNHVWTGTMSDYLTGTWFSLGASALAPGDLVASMFVTRGAGISFSGQIGLSVGPVSDVTFTMAAALLPGDANGDGNVDGTDLNTVLSNYGMTSGATWAMGDFNGDGAVDGTDLNTVLSNYGTSSGITAAVPEPGTLLLAAAGLVGLLCCAWRKQR